MKHIIQKIMPLYLLVTSFALASDIAVDSLGLNIGTSNSSYSQTNNSGTIVLGNEPDKSFNSYEFYATLKNDIYGMKPYVSYTYSNNSDLKHQYLLAGLNKYYQYKKITLYAGVVGGYGQLDWKYDPLNNSQKKIEDTNSFIAGIQVGVEYPLSNKFAVSLNSKYLIHDYETDLKTTNATSTIKHDSSFLVSIGVKYSF